jgi:cell division protein FtsI (penicillin-binding protein 3)
VLLDAHTGEVLAMVNQPGYNPNKDRSNKRGRLRNRAITDVFEPGSTMKPFIVAAGLESGRYRPDSTIDTSPGYFKVGSARVRDEHDLGVIDLATLLRKSSNVGAGKIALDLPKEDLYEWMRRLGFGEPLAVGFPGEASGQLAPPSRWAQIDQATLAFGYGISVSTLQLAQAYAVLAADGVRHPVSLLRLNETPAGERVFSAETTRALLPMLEQVVSDTGTASEAAIAGYRVAGKTGTVKKLGRDGYSDDRYRALFAGMAPASDPRLVMVVMIDEPRRDEFYGGKVAAPVFSRVMGDALRLLNISPDALPGTELRMAASGAAE